MEAIACSGVAYEVLGDGRVKVNGELPAYVQGNANWPIARKVWDQWGSLIQKHAQRVGVPAIWVAGIMCQESGGDPNACSPCDVRVCSFAPNCGGPCCAYGLMQFIRQTAKGYGVDDVDDLRRNPELAISKACDLIAHLSKTYGGDITKIASAYNAGSHKCRYFGMFGNSAKSQGDYVGKIVQFSNTVASFGPASGGWAGDASKASSGGIQAVAFGLAAAAAYVATRKLRERFAA
jgi:soluble lytic murein transglycosylase-like protein